MAYDADMERLNNSPRWRTVRGQAIRRQPLCARCDRAVAEIVDHIVPARDAIAQAQQSGAYNIDRYAGYFLVSNLQGLCRPCHWTKTNEDKLHTGSWPDVVAVERAQPKRRYSF